MIEEEIEINASAEKVRQTFPDFASYPEWSKFLDEIIIEKPNGESLKNGDKLLVTLDVGSNLDMKPSVLKNDRAEFQWMDGLEIPFIFNRIHRFQFENIVDKKTKFVQSESYTGI